jgi:peptidoglycan/xylan/chitin deacetylase (PgdA/CDA1 family)
MRLTCCLAIALLWASAMPAEASQLRIVLRYDDYSHSSSADMEKDLFAAVGAVGGGILVGVVPFSDDAAVATGSETTTAAVGLDADKLGLLRDYVTQGVVEVAIHGASHTNAASQDHPKSEFAGLPEDSQSRSLRVARTALEAALGSRIDSFIPPYNRYDRQTLTALESSGFRLLSAGFGGPTLHEGTLTHLPAGPFPQALRDVVSEALSQGHTDALVILTIHPYDIAGSGEEMAAFRRGSPQISTQDLAGDLRQLHSFADVRFLTIDELLEDEDLSPMRLQANLKLRDSLVTRYRLVPDVLGIYPLEGLYYSRRSAQGMYLLQGAAFAVCYGGMAVLFAYLTLTLRRLLRDRASRSTILIDV